MSLNGYQSDRLISNLDRIATALERLADNHGAPAPEVEPELSTAPQWIPNTVSPDFDS